MRHLYYILQTLLRGRTSSFIKLVSLTLGLTVGVLLFSQIAYELNYERCYPESEKLVLVRRYITNTVSGTSGGWYDDDTYDVMAPTLAQDMPQWVESATTVCSYAGGTVFYENRRLDDVDYLLADTCFFRTMGIDVLKGNPRDMIMPGTVFVSDRFAHETFGDADPMGKTFTIDKQDTLTVRGIYRGMPHNSMLIHDFVRTVHQDGGYMNGASWNGNDVFYAILRLRNATDVEALNANLQRTVQQHTETEWDGWKSHFSVIPLPQFHTANSDVCKRLLILGVLGFAIFFVSAMNYILVAIASLGRRAKAVGVYKCSGAGTGEIFLLFLLETGLFVLLAAAFSCLLIFLFRDLIEGVLGVGVPELFTWQTLWVPLLTVLLLIVMAGVLPGKMFARVPVTQLFRRYTDGKRGWKSTLLAIQFTGISFVLGLLTVTALQYSMLTKRDMGICLPGLVEAGCWLEKSVGEHVCDYLRRQPYVEGVTAGTSGVLGQYWTTGLFGNDGKRIAVLNYNIVHRNYPEVMGIEIIEGGPLRNKGDLLVNEELVRLMKWTDGAVGKHLNGVSDRWGTIVGVFRDVRNMGFQFIQPPIALLANEDFYNKFEVRLKQPCNDNLRRLNAFVEEAFPNLSLQFIPVADKVKSLYTDVSRFRNAVWFTTASILLIVLIGLIGYVNDETQRRSKEIAIRKVNGAEVRDILILLSRGILNVAVPTVLLGMAVSWWVGTVWLGQFVEQITVNPLMFVGITLLILVFIVGTVVCRAWHIANENPVLSIKSE